MRIGCTVITTVGSDDKIERCKDLGADHVINYREDRFEGAVRKITKKKGVDVVFEHVGKDTWAGSMLSLRRGVNAAAGGYDWKAAGISVFDFLVRDMSKHALTLSLQPSSSEAQAERCRNLLRKPVGVEGRFDRVWQNHVEPLDGAYAMNP